MPLPRDHEIEPPPIDQPYLTDAGLFQWTIAKRLDVMGSTTTVFWRGGEEVMWIPLQPDGNAPLDQLLRTYRTPQLAAAAFFAVYPEYRS